MANLVQRVARLYPFGYQLNLLQTNAVLQVSYAMVVHQSCPLQQ